MSDANTNYGGAGNDTLLMDFNIFNQRRTSMLSAVDRLVFDTRPSQMEGKVCGTETIMELMSQWDKVAKTSMNFRDFYMGCVDKSLVETADSIYATNDQVANALNIFGDSTNVFGSVQGDDTLVEMLANQDPGLIDAINGLENAGDQDPGYLAALHAAMLQSGYNLNKVGDREEFMERFNIDEATMERVEAMAKECENGDTSCLDNYNQFQNLSKEEWGNLTDEQYQEFTDLVVLNAYAGYMVENGDNLSASELETYNTINTKTLQKMYPVDKNGNAKVDVSLVNAMESAYVSLGADDTLAYNMLIKVEIDKTSYRVYDPNTQANEGQEVSVVMTYDENGFADVLIGDNKPFGKGRQFLATSRDNAAKHLEQVRATVDSYDTHGMSDDELIGMFQVAENPNDLQIAENIAKSDHEFKVNGKNAFDIEYWEVNTYPNNLGELCTENRPRYSVGVSDRFSVSLGQMGANMIKNGDLEDYKEFVNAAMEQSAEDRLRERGKEHPYKHDIVLAIASGAGIYADNCSLNVVNDEIGGDNDKELEDNLKAAAYNFGIFSALDEKFEHDWYDLRDDTIGRVTGIKYIEDGSLELTIKSKDNVGGITFGEEKYNTIRANVVVGKKALSDKFTHMGKELRKEFNRKRNELVIDTVVDTIGIFCPGLKGVMKVGIDIAKNDNATTDTVDMIKDGVELSKKMEKTVTFGNTMMEGYVKYNELTEWLVTEKKKKEDLQNLLSFYSYNTGSDTVGLYDYDNIRRIQEWEKNGVVQITTNCELSNDEIYNKVYGGDNPDDYNRVVIQAIGTELCGEGFDYLSETSDTTMPKETDRAYETIEAESGYTKEEIDNAMNIVIYGHCEDAGAEYKNVTDVPPELMNACFKALEYYNIDVHTYWG